MTGRDSLPHHYGGRSRPFVQYSTCMMLIPFLSGVLSGKVGITEVEVIMVEVKRIVKYTCFFIMMCCVFRREMMIIVIRMFRLMMKKGVRMMDHWNMKRMMMIY